MGFSIDYDTGPIGWLVIAVLIGAAVLVAVFLFSAANTARKEVITEEQDKGHDPPVA